MVRDYNACKYCVPLREGRVLYHHQLCLELKKLNESKSGRLIPGRMNKGGVNEPPTTPRPKRPPKGMGK